MGRGLQWFTVIVLTLFGTAYIGPNTAEKLGFLAPIDKPQTSSPPLPPSIAEAATVDPKSALSLMRESYKHQRDIKEAEMQGRLIVLKEENANELERLKEEQTHSLALAKAKSDTNISIKKLELQSQENEMEIRKKLEEQRMNMAKELAKEKNTALREAKVEELKKKRADELYRLYYQTKSSLDHTMTRVARMQKGDPDEILMAEEVRRKRFNDLCNECLDQIQEDISIYEKELRQRYGLPPLEMLEP